MHNKMKAFKKCKDDGTAPDCNSYKEKNKTCKREKEAKITYEIFLG